MQSAGRAVIFVTLLAILVGGFVVLWKNDWRPAGMFEAYRKQNLRTNSNYYPQVDKSGEPIEHEYNPQEAY